MYKKTMIKEENLRHLGVKYECMEHYSKGAPRCADCGCHDLRELVLDHTNGGGCEERRRLCLGIGGHHYYSYLRKQNYPDDMGLEVRCDACHKKRHALEGSVKISHIAISIEFGPVNPIPDAQEQSLWDALSVDSLQSINTRIEIGVRAVKVAADYQQSVLAAEKAR